MLKIGVSLELKHKKKFTDVKHELLSAVKNKSVDIKWNNTEILQNLRDD